MLQGSPKFLDQLRLEYRMDLFFVGPIFARQNQQSLSVEHSAKSSKSQKNGINTQEATISGPKGTYIVTFGV